MRKAYVRAITATTTIATAAIGWVPSMASAAPAQSTTQGLAKGRLLTADGRPAAGALIAIYAMPVETASSHLNEGDSGTLPLLGQFRTDKQGRYAAVSRAALAPFRAPTGEINLQLLARDTTGNVASLGFGLEPQAPGTGAAARVDPSSSLIPVSVTDLTLATTKDTLAKNSAVTPAQKASGQTVRTVGADLATRAGDPGTEAKAWTTPLAKNDTFVNGTGSSDIVASPSIVACIWNLVSDLGLKTVWVGGTYVKATGVSADVEYNSGASSTLGIGVSTSGAYGTYSQSGTVSAASSGSINFPTNYGFQHVYTQFRYGKYGYSCDTSPGFSKYEVRARYWAGGASTYAPSTSPSAPYCVSQTAGSKFRKTTSTAYEFSTGADVSGSIGIDLSTRTGFTTALTNYFAFTYTRHLCGASDYPGGSPRRLVAQV